MRIPLDVPFRGIQSDLGRIHQSDLGHIQSDLGRVQLGLRHIQSDLGRIHLGLGVLKISIGALDIFDGGVEKFQWRC